LSNPNTSEKSNDLDRQENQTKGNVSAKKVVVHYYSPGTDTLLPINTDNPLPITGSITASASTLADFSANDLGDPYFGFTKPDGTWLVLNKSATTVSYATVTNNGTVTSYTDAWTNKATLTYGRFDQAF
jgi:hypothetical protein